MIIAPGRDDRAFYKYLVLKVFNVNHEGVRVFDNKFREDVINYVFKGSSPELRGIIVLTVANANGGCAHVIIIPSSEDVRKRMHLILEYLAGMSPDELSQRKIDYVIVAEDAEEKGFDAALQSLEDSLYSRSNTIGIAIENVREGGKYYRLYRLAKAAGVKLLLVVQGLEHASPSLADMGGLHKHAIEDYLLFLLDDVLEELVQGHRSLVERILGDGNAHKKLALVAMVYNCGVSVENALRDIGRERFLKLVKESDGLRAVVDAIGETAGYTPL